MYNTIEDLCRTAEERNQPMWMEILEDEMRCTDKCEDDVWKELENRYDIMKMERQRHLVNLEDAFGKQ